MAAGKVPTSNITALYNNTTAGTDADPAAVDNAVQDIVQTINDNFDKQVLDISGHASNAVLSHPDKSVIRAKLADKVVGAGQLDDAAVGQSHHQDNGIPSRAIGDNVILRRHMSDGAVGPDEIQTSGVQRQHIQIGAVGASQLDPSLIQNYGDIAVLAKIAELSQDASITVTVGTTGDFATINAALEYLSRKKLKYSKDGIKAEIKLLSGFVMAEQILVEGINLGWIRIISESATVSISRASLTKSLIIPAFGGSGQITSYPAFGGINNAVLPIIAVLFDMDATGEAGARSAFFAGNGSQITIEQGKGCTHAGGQGIYCVQGSRVNASGANLSYAGANAVSAFRSAYVEIRDSNLSYAGAYGIYGDNNSFIDCAGANISNAVNAGIWAASCSYVTAVSAIISNCGANGIQADNCSMIDAHSATINNSVQRGVQCASASVISVTSATIIGSGFQGINCEKSGRVDAQGATVTGSILKGVWATYGGTINISGGNAQMGASPSGNDIVVGSGGIIIASGVTGGLSKLANFVDQNGLIISTNVVDQNTATLSNGWTGNLYYGKNGYNQVWLRGTLTAGTVTTDTLIASLPFGYRPNSNIVTFSVLANGSVVSNIAISTGGGVSIKGSNIPAGATVEINILYQA